MSSTSEEDSEPSSGPRLPLLSLPPMRPKSFETLSPLHHSASVPFRWEEEPGKPRPCQTNPLPFKGLHLPPRLQSESKFTKTPSPTTVLEGPYVGRSVFHSLRVVRHRDEGWGSSPERRGSLGLSRRWLMQGRGFKGGTSFLDESPSFRGRRRRNLKEGVDEGSFVFLGGEVEEVARTQGHTRKKSLLGLSKPASNFWATIYGAAKQVIPSLRRSRWSN